MQISFVKFASPVTMGTHAREGWSRDSGINGPASDGKIEVAEKPVGLVFTYVAGKVAQEVTVPWGNISHVTRTPGAEPAAPAKAAK